MDTASLQRFAPPSVTALICFLAFSSQWLFYHIEPGALEEQQAYLLNTLVACLLVCYWRTCLTDPGRVPLNWQDRVQNQEGQKAEDLTPETAALSNRWCRRCEAYKPPRAHHCKTCNRCIPKMDHHCVWTANCVSHRTIPHFIRFIAYAVAAMTCLEYYLYLRGSVLWEKRRLPSVCLSLSFHLAVMMFLTLKNPRAWERISMSLPHAERFLTLRKQYLGPSPLQLAHLFVLFSINSFTLFMLAILLVRVIWSLALNTWQIESWEIERHHTLLRRARALGGFLHAQDGRKITITHQEFPYDVGIWSNICQGMGTWNVLAWFWPFSSSLPIDSGLGPWEHNGIEDPSKPWPPPDPDRLYRAPQRDFTENPFTQPLEVEAFRQRQAADLGRYDADGEYVVHRRPFYQRLEDAGHQYPDDDDAELSNDEDGLLSGTRGRGRYRDGKHTEDEGEEAWRNQEGERLADFGVDEVADFYDEDEVPLAELIAQKTAKKAQ